MTETVLNALWFILAIASFGLLFRSFAYRSAEPSRSSTRFQCVVALGCILAILFPVISLTDDLHDMQAAVEDPASSGMTAKKFGVNRQLTPTRAQHQLLFIISLLPTTVGLAAFGHAAIRQTVLLSSGLSLNTFGRAPPSC
ncbi:MAG TPA: hypothetical protein VK709_07955 [Candidatus Saccharimonadales bacterium]|jgi:hypothetical protein|nr:hypothetical protein [Candidatus Saccharimonadales bacterium]